MVSGLLRREGGQLRDLIASTAAILDATYSPLWAAVSAVILFPITIALSELPTYFGYVMPRLEALSGRRWLAVLLPAFFLAIQHGALPLIFDGRFIAWRVLRYVALTVPVGLLLRWRPRLMPYLIIGHYLIDLMTVVMILMPPV